MPESVLTILKFCFLALLYLFLYRVVRVVISEMRAPAPSPPAPVAQAAAPAVAARTEKTRGRTPSKIRVLEPAARRGETFVLTDELTIGRGGGCGIVLDDGFVSQVHARLYLRDGNAYVEDLGSRNGTLVNGQPLQGALQLRRGDRVQFGQTTLEAVR
ncbi:MAG TPA: FHA domain-containing protein [Acidimicrobiia bacterium]|nr:FHA domain-containing protein [Acidimicrobiia bacterium]